MRGRKVAPRFGAGAGIVLDARRVRIGLRQLDPLRTRADEFAALGGAHGGGEARVPGLLANQRLGDDLGAEGGHVGRDVEPELGDGGGYGVRDHAIGRFIIAVGLKDGRADRAR